MPVPQRNILRIGKSIKEAFTHGVSIEQLSAEYHLAVETIKKLYIRNNF